MAYNRASALSALKVATTNFFRPAYLKDSARAALDWDFARRTAHIERVPLGGLLPAPAGVTVTIAPQLYGDTPYIDLLAVCTLVRMRQPKTIFEFGTFTGLATISMAVNAPDARIHTLDLSPQQRRETLGLDWEKEVDDTLIGRYFRNTLHAPRITQLFSDSLKFDPAPHERQMDFIWVDACHDEPFVTNDSDKALRMAAPGAVIAWHDFSRVCPAVTSYVQNLGKSRKVQAIEGTRVAFCRI